MALFSRSQLAAKPGMAAAKPGMAAAKPGMAAAKPGMAARTGWLSVAMAAALGLGVIACGGEVVVGDDHAAAGGGPSPTGLPPTTGSCQLCGDLVECGHCLIQAQDDTYRCPPSLPAPSSGCMDLQEQHRDANGELYTCYYCD